MERAFGLHGGIVCDAELARLLRPYARQPSSLLARWIVGGEVVSFEWRSSTMLPIFQFDLADMTVRAAVSEVLWELRDAFDDWELALWFAQPNVGLGGRSPVDVVAVDPAYVLTAARTDRSIVGP